jgi:transglutaminase-like putative cysteine protease
VSDTTTRLEGRRVSYSATLERPATTPPTVWRPVSVSGESDLRLSDGLLARASEPLPAGASDDGTSRIPPRNVSVLRASGRDYPSYIADRYTELPAETRDRLEPFAADLTENASSPYGTAVRIERWLEASKEYSLNVSTPPDGDVASQFVFEMEAGYCEYFATAMVAMVRSQGIPARYVVGYSTGEQVGPDTYEVRAMNAHAWVEVFFEGVGWVRFDPTPGQARLAQERQSFEESESGTYSPREEGSPGEVDSPTESNISEEETATPTPTPTPSDPSETPTPEGDEGTTVSLNRSAVPGATVEVSVTRGGQPVVDARVLFNGDSVGRTDEDGTLVATVPYVRNLTVTVSGGWSYDEANSSQDLQFGGAGPSVGVGPPGDDRLYAGADTWPGPADHNGTGENASESFAVETNPTLAVTGDVRSGSEVTITVTVDGVPVPEATLRLDGDTAATTDDSGRATVTLPPTTGNVTLSVRRGPVAGNRTLRIPALAVSVTPSWPLPLAGTSVDVNATLDGDPASGIPVRLGGDRVGTTGPDGTLSTRLPFASEVPVVVVAGGQRVRTTVSNPLLNLLGAVGVLVLVVASVGGLLYRRGVTPRAAVAWLGRAASTVYRGIVGGIVGLALAANRLVSSLEDALSRAYAALIAVAARRLSLAELLASLRAWLLSSAPASMRERATDPDGIDGEETGVQANVKGTYPTVREAWARFLATVSIRRPWTRTPAQLAEHAIEHDGLPPEAVRTLRDEFRAVEYGDRSPDDAVPALETAVETIERTASPEEGDD